MIEGYKAYKEDEQEAAFLAFAHGGMLAGEDEEKCGIDGRGACSCFLKPGHVGSLHACCNNYSKPGQAGSMHARWFS